MKIKFQNELKVLASITQKRAVKALFSLWSLKNMKLVFIEKVKKKRFYINTYRQLNSHEYTYFETSKVQKLLLRLFFLQFIKIMFFNIMLKSI